ncbi:MAG: cell division protein FtsZ [Allosphingosinicella sp.]
MEELSPRIVVIGVGGAGGNAVGNMIRNQVGGVEFVAANTDAQALRSSSADRIVQLGRGTTEGLGAGSRAEIGRAAAEESIDDIERVLTGAHMCFIAAGLGGGTGTGAAPVIARVARQLGILTIGVVTRPFAFEGGRRARAAEAGLIELEQHVDSLIVIPNQNLFRLANPNTTFKEAFDLADDVLQQGVRGITDLMVMPGFINLDFADVRTVMSNMGRAMMGTGEASGEGRARAAAEAAIANPLLDESLDGARGLLISISGGDDMGLMEVDEAASWIKTLVDAEADIIWGSSFNPALGGRLRVSVVATGLDSPRAAVVTPALEALAPKKAVAKSPAARPARETHPVIEPLPAAATVAPAAAPAIVIMPRQPAAAEGLPAARPLQDELLFELLLTPEEEMRPAAPVPAPPAAPLVQELMRGPSLFERMAMAARGAVTPQRDMPTYLPVRREPVFLDRRDAA